MVKCPSIHFFYLLSSRGSLSALKWRWNMEVLWMMWDQGLTFTLHWQQLPFHFSISLFLSGCDIRLCHTEIIMKDRQSYKAFTLLPRSLTIFITECWSIFFVFENSAAIWTEGKAHRSRKHYDDERKLNILQKFTFDYKHFNIHFKKIFKNALTIICI